MKKVKMLPFVVNVPSEISISKNRLGEIKVRSQMRSSLLKNSAAISRPILAAPAVVLLDLIN